MKFLSRAWARHSLLYPSPSQLNYSWGLGSALGLLIALQVLTGILLSFYYRPAELTAFSDVIFMINEVNSGYLFKYLHLNGATFIFLLLYLHFFRGIYYRSYVALPKVWLTGMLLFILMIVTAFLGYVLPWGQMSFWAATVITNLVTSIPYIGQKLIILIHGAFSVQGATLNRFFVVHFLLAIVVLIVIIFHILLLHQEGSSSPVGRVVNLDKAYFYHYYVYKDLYFFLVVCFLLFFVALLYPNYFNHPDNFVEANPLVTPAHIVPEWYFLPFYAMLRAVPNKLFGVVVMLSSLVFLFFLPLLTKIRFENDSLAETSLSLLFYGIVFSLIILGYLGSMPAEAPYVFLSQFFTGLYFSLFFLPMFANSTFKAYKKAIKYF